MSVAVGDEGNVGVAEEIYIYHPADEASAPHLNKDGSFSNSR